MAEWSLSASRSNGWWFRTSRYRGNIFENFLYVILFFKWATPGLLFIFVFSTVIFGHYKFCPWLDSNVLYWKRPLCQLSHNHCPCTLYYYKEQNKEKIHPCNEKEIVIIGLIYKAIKWYGSGGLHFALWPSEFESSWIKKLKKDSIHPWTDLLKGRSRDYSVKG